MLPQMTICRSKKILLQQNQWAASTPPKYLLKGDIMAEVKWIKIVTDIFDDEKILLIDGMPDRDAIIVIWFKLLCFAGKNNNGGVFMFNNKIAYTDEMLSTIFNRPLNTVRLALNTFEMFGMIEIVNDTITIPNWEKHQQLDKFEKSKEQTRKRVAAYREKQKTICNANSNVTVTQSNADRRDIDKDKEIDIDRESNLSASADTRTSLDYQSIISLFNSICTSLPKVTKVTEERKRRIKAAYKQINGDFQAFFERIEKSEFLTGKNGKWDGCSFDWILKPSNMIKIIEGNYDNKKTAQSENYEAAYDLAEYEGTSIVDEGDWE